MAQEGIGLGMGGIPEISSYQHKVRKLLQRAMKVTSKGGQDSRVAFFLSQLM